jgi:hypothetical protein
MAKKKTQPKPANKASYASKTAPRVKDKEQPPAPKATESETDSSNSTGSGSTSSEEETENTQPQRKGPNIINAQKRGPLAKNKVTKTKRTKVLAEIRSLQKSTELLIPRAPFLRLVSFSNSKKLFQIQAFPHLLVHKRMFIICSFRVKFELARCRN